ncbi:type IV toxin-antitoxin system AbiEi family antitoxin domain-containing protein [Streptomyces winkii]|uniref:type IV toxin-antitoxin system AbiEi family antitoxin domain-containing protein n=1 Tax=Streptomyces winkii TaxID=3051178 RepID=UPI0028D276E0|nr:type IV toxin-antitoxin system AbiEi family antitoxin domain-containing protein [Streptomyces sp. DSM 40971]
MIDGPGDGGDLPATFRYSEARRLHVSDRALRRLQREGRVERVSRGLYRRTDADPMVDLGLVEVAHRSPVATMCLASALSRHGLTDEIPSAVDLAIPRGRRPPCVASPVAWHHFAAETFHIGREALRVGPEEEIGIYNAERCIVDAFRLRHQEGSELGVEALRAWLRRRGSSPSALMSMAGRFPQAAAPLRSALEILL